MSRSFLLECVLVGAACLFSAGWSAPCPADEFKPSAAEAAIEESLKSPTSLEFSDTPLSDVIDFLKDSHKIQIQIDRKALDETGIASDSPVTMNLKAVPLRSAMALVLNQLGLCFVVQDDILLITTPEQADARQLIRVYQVDDLTGSRDSSAAPTLRPESLVKMISTCVDPTSWSPVGGPGEIVPISPGNKDVLVITQSYAVHHKIAGLLARLREAAGASGSSQTAKPKK